MKKRAVALTLCLLLMALALPLPAAGAEVEADLSRSVSISFRENTLFIDPQGVLYAVHDPEYDIYNQSQDAPPPEAIMENVAAVWGSDWATFALDEAGTLWSWGNNADGNLGYVGLSLKPVKVLDGVVDFSMANRGYCLAVKQDGTLWAWGVMPGQAADTEWQHQTRPVQVMADVKTPHAGASIGLAVDDADTLWSWTSRWDDAAGMWSFAPFAVMDGVDSLSSDMAIDRDGVLWHLRTSSDAPGTVTPVKVMEKTMQVTRPGWDFYLVRDSLSNLWALGAYLPEENITKITSGCAQIVEGGNGRFYDYIDLSGTLRRMTHIPGEGFDIESVEPDVRFATGDSDTLTGCIKKDGSLLLIRHSYVYKEGGQTVHTTVTRGTVSRAVLDAPLGSARPGLPLYEGYQPDVTPRTTFDDIGGHWAQSAIETWASYGIVQGDGDSFRPDDTVTRAEFAAILNRILCYPAAQPRSFTDVPAGAWYRQDIATAHAQGILLGDGTGAMRPLDTITLEEAAVIIARALSLEYTETTPTDYYSLEIPFDFASASPWARTVLTNMYNNWQIPSYEHRWLFQPRDAITRGGVMGLLSRFITHYIPDGSYYHGHGDTLSGTTLIAAGESTLRDVTFSGDVYLLGNRAGQGADMYLHLCPVLLRDVKIGGTLFIEAPERSVTLQDCTVTRIRTAPNSFSEVVATGDTAVETVTLPGAAWITAENLDAEAEGFRTVILGEGPDTGSETRLSGHFERLITLRRDAALDLTGTVDAYFPATGSTLTGDYSVEVTHPEGAVPHDLREWSFLGMPEGSLVFGLLEYRDALYAWGRGLHRLTGPGQWEMFFDDYVYEAAAHDGMLYFYSMAEDGPIYWHYDGEALSQQGSEGPQRSTTVFQGAAYTAAHDRLLVLGADGTWLPVPGWPEGHRIHSMTATEDTLYIGVGIYIGVGDYGHKGEYIDGYLMAFDGQTFTPLIEPLTDEQIRAIGLLEDRIFIGTSHEHYLANRYEVVDGALVPQSAGLDWTFFSTDFITFEGVLFTGILDSGTLTYGVYGFNPLTARWMPCRLKGMRVHDLIIFQGRLIAGAEQGIYALQ